MDINEVLLKLQNTPQGTRWHPEGNTLNHTAFVWASLREHTHLQWVALFHDLGKIDTTIFNDKGNGTIKITSYNHEELSLQYIDKFVDIIPSDIDIQWLKKMVKNHMKIKLMDKMRPTKRDAFRAEFSDKEILDLAIFSDADDAVHYWQNSTPKQRRKDYFEFLYWVESVFNITYEQHFLDLDLFKIIEPPTMYFVRGVSGSGKTSFANTLSYALGHDVRLYEADNYFYNENGEYNWSADKLHDAHNYCKNMVIENMISSTRPDVIVSNTSTSKKEVDIYQEIAYNLGYRFISLIVENRHGTKSIHGVPDEVLQRQRGRFDIKL